MYVCMYVCMHTYAYVCVYIYIHKCMWVYMCVCMHIYIYVYVCVCIYIYIYIHAHSLQRQASAGRPSLVRSALWCESSLARRFHVRVLLSIQQPTFQTSTTVNNDLSSAWSDFLSFRVKFRNVGSLK